MPPESLIGSRHHRCPGESIWSSKTKSLLPELSQHLLFFFSSVLSCFLSFFLGRVGKATLRGQTQSSFLTHAHACQELASFHISWRQGDGVTAPQRLSVAGHRGKRAPSEVYPRWPCEREEFQRYYATTSGTQNMGNRDNPDMTPGIR